MKKKLLVLLLIAFVTGGCYNDSEEELYNCSADAGNTKYSTNITAILASYGCIGCHNTGGPSGGIALEKYAGVKATVTSGRLLGSINHDPGFKAMPQGGNKMNACDIKKVKAWIDAGALNN